MSVTVYSSPACAYCHMAKEYLKSKKVAFKEYDISDNPKAYQWVMDNVGQAVTPVLDVNGTVVLGFDRPKIDAALATK
ncbi:NrdH-redoxin [Candidatus Saccharibacteria bacterium]|nr:MAG: NrdH-redoxin [Candidatus Saccharibacteria bacterium]